jgi:hypothetical protein
MSPRPARANLQDPVLTMYKNAPVRLVAAFLTDVDVADLVPPILKQYTSRVQMALSNLQVLEAVDESVLQIVLDEVSKRTGAKHQVCPPPRVRHLARTCDYRTSSIRALSIIQST